MRISDWSSDVCSSDLLIGSAFATKAVWQIMRDQNYGRVLMTTSSAGLGGNFGQANYAAAKAGVIGLARTLRLEGAKQDSRDRQRLEQGKRVAERIAIRGRLIITQTTTNEADNK